MNNNDTKLFKITDYLVISILVFVSMMTLRCDTTSGNGEPKWVGTWRVTSSPSDPDPEVTYYELSKDTISFYTTAGSGEEKICQFEKREIVDIESGTIKYYDFDATSQTSTAELDVSGNTMVFEIVDSATGGEDLITRLESVDGEPEELIGLGPCEDGPL